MEGAVHGLYLVLVSLHVHLVEHAVLVEVKVAGRFPQIQVRHVRRVQ